MKLFGVVICVGLFALTAFPARLLAQQKTVKACQEEWRRNTPAKQATGIPEKAYVTQRRAGAASAQPASTPGPAPSAVAPAPVKTAKACRDEWQANKAAYQAAK